MNELWRGLRESARQRLNQRDYRAGTVAEQLATTGVEAGKAVSLNRSEADWIPGVEIFPRTVYPQRHRGFFGEFARQGEGVLGRIGLWPAQWAAATMFAGTAKGFHVHPPFVPEGEEPEQWFHRLYVTEPENHALRPYAKEQWDVMFIPAGVVEMILVDERAGLPRRIMRIIVDGDNHRGPNNVGVVIPAGVAHALRVEGSRDAMMVYGTSTVFAPDFEGRIAAGIESASLSQEWADFLADKS